MGALVRQWQSIPTELGEARMYTAMVQSAGQVPALLILHSIVGIDDHIKTMADEFANEGYFVAVPDLYFNDEVYRELPMSDIERAAHMSRDRAERDAELLRYDEKKRANILRASEWILNRPNDSYIWPTQGAFRAISQRPDVRGVGAIGFCMGGRLVGELAETTPELVAGVIHYGRPPKPGSAETIRSALQGHFASRDTGITGKVPAFAEAMAKAGKSFDYYIYEADHGFSIGPHSPAYNPDASRLSMDRSRQFLRRHLNPQPVLVDAGSSQ